MKTAVFKISEMIAELNENLLTQNELLRAYLKKIEGAEELSKAEHSQFETIKEVIEKIKARLSALEAYKDLTVTVRRYSAKQKDILEQALMNPTMQVRGNRTAQEVKVDIAAFKKKAIQFGVIGMEPRMVEMTKIKEAGNGEPEVWQIPDAVLDGDNFDWDLRDILLEMVEEVNPKNWS